MNKDPYASEQETFELLIPDERSSAQFQLDVLLEMNGAWEQGSDPYQVLYGIAIKLLEQSNGN
jgi:hypothetical protein